jgi:lipopolysaccharide export LptBFGC system permease protein LptF
MADLALTIIAIFTPIISLISGIWGLTKETTEKEQDGSKSLTSAGRLLVGLSVVSAFVAVSSVGFKAIVETEAQRARNRKEFDEHAWKKFTNLYQAALAQMGIDAANQNAKLVIQNDNILSDLSFSRMQNIENAEKVFQLYQHQRVIDQSQSLSSLKISLRFGGFLPEELQKLKSSLKDTEDLPNIDDDYARLIESRSEFDRANNFAGALLQSIGFLHMI